MLVKTEGIVLRTIPFSETSVIARVYTRRAGLEGLIMNGLRRKGSGKHALLQPLTLVDLVYYDKAHKGLKRVKELTCRQPFRSIPFDMAKSAMAIFMAELISISVREVEPDEALFNFLDTSLCMLDECREAAEMYHLHFVIHLSRYLGFFPDHQLYRPGYLFNLTQGTFSSHVAAMEVSLNAPLTELLVRLQKSGWDELAGLRADRADRMYLLDTLVLYYELHLPQGTKLKSHRVLHETLA